MVNITRSDVEKLDSTSWQQLDDTKKDELVSIAERMIDNQFGGRISTLGTLEGDEDDAAKFLAAHLFELSEGGEAQSESTTGGSVNYNTVTGDMVDGLSETRWGRMFSSEFLDRGGIGVVRTQ